MSRNSVRLRRATPADAASIAAVHRAAFGDALHWIPTLHTAAEDLAYFSVVVTEQRTTVAEVDDEVVAFAASTDGWLNHLYVAPSHQGRGIGKLLLDEVKRSHTDREPVAGLSLWTFQRNWGARRFYEVNGLVPEEFTGGERNEEREPDVRYLWRQPAR